MIVPAAGFIEMAQERLQTASYIAKHSRMLLDQLHEVRSAIPGRSDEFYEAYAIGIETARILLEGMTSEARSKVQL